MSEGDDWCTIESDPGVFTELLETVGCKTVELQELWSLDDDSLQTLQSSTGAVYGLVFLFQWIGKQQQEHAATKEPLAEEDTPDDLFFAHQITTNACATQAMLSVVLNAADLSDDDLGDTLAEFKAFTKEFPPHLKGVAISSQETIKKAHNSFARPDGFLTADQQHRRAAASQENEAFHFVAYVPVNGIVYELDGLQKGPMVVGAYDDNKNDKNRQDWLVQARAAIQERMAIAGEQHVKFNLMAVIQDKRLILEQRISSNNSDDSDDDDSNNHNNNQAAALLAVETAKRQQWRTENQRRRHNYVPLCVQLLKELAAAGRLPQLIQEAQEKQRQQAGQKQRQQQQKAAK